MGKTYKVHPAAMAFPRMPKSDYDELKADIAANGIRIPILLNKKKDTILDGRNRIAAAFDLKLPDAQVPIEVFGGDDDDAVKEIVSRNIMRRNLTDEQRVALLAKLIGPAIEAEADASKKAGPKAKGKGAGDSAIKLAKIAKTSQNKARAALITAKSPKDLDSVIAGKTKLSEAKKNAQAKVGKRASKPKAAKPLRERVEAKFVRFMESFAVVEYPEVRKILRDILAKTKD